MKEKTMHHFMFLLGAKYRILNIETKPHVLFFFSVNRRSLLLSLNKGMNITEKSLFYEIFQFLVNWMRKKLVSSTDACEFLTIFICWVRKMSWWMFNAKKNGKNNLSPANAKITVLFYLKWATFRFKFIAFPSFDRK